MRILTLTAMAILCVALTSCSDDSGSKKDKGPTTADQAIAKDQGPAKEAGLTPDKGPTPDGVKQTDLPSVKSDWPDKNWTCSMIGTCIQTCGATCLASCRSKGSTAAQGKFDALQGCVFQNCLTICSGTDYPKCETCMKDKCTSTYNDCQNDA
jgi:hypothetical protein